jgi:hypothetical protein
MHFQFGLEERTHWPLGYGSGSGDTQPSILKSPRTKDKSPHLINKYLLHTSYGPGTGDGVVNEGRCPYQGDTHTAGTSEQSHTHTVVLVTQQEPQAWCSGLTVMMA